MNNSFYLARKNKVLVSSFYNGKNDNHVLALMVNISSLGYTFSLELKNALARMSLAEITTFSDTLIPQLKEMVGAHVIYKPLFVNFPEGVPVDTIAFYHLRLTEYLNKHYGEFFGNMLSCGHIVITDDSFEWVNGFSMTCPLCDEYLNSNKNKIQNHRPKLHELMDLKVIGLGNIQEFCSIFTNLIGSKTSISGDDKTVCRWFMKTYGNEILSMIPDQIPHKEQFSLLTAGLLVHTTIAPVILKKHLKTATDVLRLAVALSNGDVSLAKPTKFKSFKRGDRRLILGLLNDIYEPIEDMLRHKSKWIRLSERLHPGEFANRYVSAYDAFNILRNDLPYETFNSKIELGIKESRIDDVIKLLTTRPGDFARRLDHLLRIDVANSMKTLNAFIKVAEKVSTPVLLQMYAHFKGKFNQTVRVVMPKGNVAIIKSIPVIKTELDEQFFQTVCDNIKNVLVNKLSAKHYLEKVFVDKELMNFTVPFSQRSASKSLRTISRGSRVEMSDKNIVRFFVHWKNTIDNQRVDIDLSATLYNDNWDYMEHVSYTNYSAEGYECLHSGDIVEAPNGACEFIDVDIESVIKYGGRYMVMQVYSFTQQPFSSIPELFAGIMERDDAGSGEIFEPATVKDKFDISSESKVSIPVILDLVERKMIWADLFYNNSTGRIQNVETYKNEISSICEAICVVEKINMYDLAMMHVEARGELVHTREEADVVFALDGDYSPFDVDKIVNDLL